MSEVFRYVPFGEEPEHVKTPAPIFSDFNSQSPMAQKMIKAKQDNGPQFWTEMREVIAHDIKTLPHNRFKVWASVLTIPIVSRYRFSYYIRSVMAKAHNNSLYMDALKDPGVGRADGEANIFDLFDDFPCTMNRLQMLAHLIETGFDERVSKYSNILEIGAGIGEMADVISNLGFTGQYDIYDFPELLDLQKIHHDQLGLRTKLSMGYTDTVDGLLQHYDLGIATFSLSEMPYEERLKLLDQVNVKNWLIQFSDKIFGYENKKWFDEVFVPRYQATHNVKWIECPYHKWDGDAWYLVITEKA